MNCCDKIEDQDKNKSYSFPFSTTNVHVFALSAPDMMLSSKNRDR